MLKKKAKGIRMRYISLILAFFCLIQSQELIQINSNTDFLNINSQIDYFEDPTVKLSINEIRSAQYRDLFAKSNQEVLNFGRTSSSIWLRFRLKSSETQTILLEQSKWYINDMDLFIYQDSVLVRTIENGSLRKMSEREVQGQNLVFKLNLTENETYEIYLKCQTQQVMELSLSLLSYDHFSSKEKSNHMIYGLFYGMIFLIIIYSLFFYFSMKEESYLYYIAYIFLMGFYFAHLNGLSFEYLWPNSPKLNFWSTTFTLGLGTCSIGLFSRKILNIKEYSIVLDKIVLYSSITALSLSIGPFTLPTKIAKGMTVYAIIIPFISSLFAGVYVYRKKYEPAKYYLISWLVFFIGGIMFMLRAKQILPSNAFTQNSVQFGAALQMVLLSLSLNNKINLMRVEKEKALAQKLNETEKNIALTSTFKKFVPEQFLDLLGKKNITDIKLGDEIESEMTILFSDIRSFSVITQKLGARDSFKFINAYLEKMEPSIEENSGFIDKYIGDSIMALFPKTSDHALTAAIKMQKQINKMNDRGGLLGINPIKIGVGINTGQMMLGTIGGANRMESTVISDAVNIAAQVEKRTKDYKSSILITESTFRKIKDKEAFSIRLIDRIVLNENQNRSMIYEVFDADHIDLRELKEKHINQFEEAIKAYLSEDFLKCYETLKEYVETVPNDFAATKYMELCNEHFENMD